MLRRAHVVFSFGLTLFTTSLLGFTPSFSLLASLASIPASLIPDIDLAHSHRRLMHNMLSYMLVVLLSYVLSATINMPWISIGVAIGYGSHLVLDMFTRRGIALWYPFKRKYVGVLKLRSSDPLVNTVTIMIGALLSIVAVLLMSSKIL